jgi:predicted alpha/beta superfamily hydrolase
MKRIILIIALLTGSLTLLTAGEHEYVIGEKVTFESTVLNEERTIYVYLPQSYNFSDATYPVLYLLDGRTHFLHASGIAQFLSANGMIPEMIVVAVVNVNRNKDFTPTKLSQVAVSGGAEKFMNFFSNELFPFMERNYRVQSYDILMGHSLGGTFATYVLLNKPEMFDGYVSVSPFLMYDNNLLVRETEGKLKKKFSGEIYYYMTVGNEPDYFEALEFFAKTIETKSPKGLNFEYLQMLDNSHGTMPHLSIYNGLLYIFSDWKLQPEVFNEGLAAIDKHYKYLSKKYSLDMHTPENTINWLGYTYLNKGDIEQAIIVFRENVKRFSKSANVYDSLGEAYENNNQFSGAEKNYQKAVELATSKADPNLKIYKKNLKRMQERLTHK